MRRTGARPAPAASMAPAATVVNEFTVLMWWARSR